MNGTDVVLTTNQCM